MLYVLNREAFLEASEQIPSKRGKTLVTGRESLYDKGLNNYKFDKVIYGYSLSGIPNRSFGIAVVEQFVITTDLSLLKIYQVVNGGVVFPYTLPWSLEKFIEKVDLAKASLKKEAKVKEKRTKLLTLYKENIALYKKQKKEIKENNKALKAEYTKAFQDAPESVKAFIKEPDYIPEPERPSQPIMPEYEKGYSLHIDHQERSFGWKLLSRFEFFQVEGTSFGFLRKRSELLKFSTNEAINIAKIGKMSQEEFLQEISRLDIDTPKVTEIKQSFIDSDSISIVAKYSKDMDNMLFSEEFEGVNEVKLPPLAPIKPMHAASMLAGGLGEFSKEITLGGEKNIIKAAIIKEFKSRKILMGSKEIEETVEFYEQKMGVYNLDRRELRILG